MPALASLLCVALRKDRRGPHRLAVGTINLTGKAPGRLELWRTLVILILPAVWVAVTMIAVVW